MPESADIVIGTLLVVCGLVFLFTRASFERAVDDDLRAGHLTKTEAENKRRGRVWVGIGSLTAGAGLIVSYLFLS